MMLNRLHLVLGAAVVLLLIVGLVRRYGPTAAVSLRSETIEEDTSQFEDFDSNNFENSTTINNELFPLKPGTQFDYEGVTDKDGEQVSHRVVIIVTDLTKLIGGVSSVVTWDRDYSEDQLVEAELAFFAQDNDGNVWRMGEYPEEYEEGKFVSAPTWIHGIADARAGLSMRAEPRLETPSYSQGWGPAVDWTDRGQVDQIGQEISVPVGRFEDVLVIAESSSAEPDAQQLKFYAAGVGNIRTDWRGTDVTQETLELSSITQLGPEALAEARAGALELEKHAYEISKDVYALTPPAQRTP